jgi:hypothetical protein
MRVDVMHAICIPVAAAGRQDWGNIYLLFGVVPGVELRHFESAYG